MAARRVAVVHHYDGVFGGFLFLLLCLDVCMVYDIVPGILAGHLGLDVGEG